MPSHPPRVSPRWQEAKGLLENSRRCDGRTGAGRRRRVGQRSVVAVLAVAAPRALAAVEAVRRTARALEVLGGRLVEAPAACCGGGKKRSESRSRKDAPTAWAGFGHLSAGLPHSDSSSSSSPKDERLTLPRTPKSSLFLFGVLLAHVLADRLAGFPYPRWPAPRTTAHNKLQI